MKEIHKVTQRGKKDPGGKSKEWREAFEKQVNATCAMYKGIILIYMCMSKYKVG